MISFQSSSEFLGFFRAVWVHTIILATKFFFYCKSFLIFKQSLSMKTIGVTSKEHFASIHSNFFQETG
ncbi:unnamed protein product [Nezara viridula]|uniref:Uncharacterized protein n=1 Tax=Nezara viridula TaxID=85310 RepID=A0A9P0H4N2_NEZVI|nr:unnamed protein product [Nezara viridula]